MISDLYCKIDPKSQNTFDTYQYYTHTKVKKMALEDDICVLKLVNTTSNVNGHILSAHQTIPKQIFVNGFGHFAMQKYFSIHHRIGHLSMSQDDYGHTCLLSSSNCLCWLADVSIMTLCSRQNVYDISMLWILRYQFEMTLVNTLRCHYNEVNFLK